MKKYILLLMFLSTCFVLSSQDKAGYAYLYEDFQKGTVVFKSGYTTQAPLNYELVSEKIHFIDENNNILELAHPETVDHIEIGDNVFEHIKGSTFYQKVNIENIDLYIKHTASVTSKGKYAGYGGYSQTTSIKNMSRIDTPGYNLKLENNEMYDVKKKDFFHLKINGKFKQFQSANSFAKLFKKQENEIKEAIKDKNTDFKNIDEVIEVVRFCGESLNLTTKD